MHSQALSFFFFFFILLQQFLLFCKVYYIKSKLKSALLSGCNATKQDQHPGDIFQGILSLSRGRLFGKRDEWIST